MNGARNCTHYFFFNSLKIKGEVSTQRLIAAGAISTKLTQLLHTLFLNHISFVLKSTVTIASNHGALNYYKVTYFKLASANFYNRLILACYIKVKPCPQYVVLNLVGSDSRTNYHPTVLYPSLKS